MEGAANDPLKKAGLIRDIIETIAIIPDPIIRSTYTRECSIIMDISEQVLITELNKILRKAVSKSWEAEKEETEIPAPEDAEPPTAWDESTEFHEYDLLRLALNYGNQVILFPEEKDEEGNPISERVADFIVREVAADQIPFENQTYGTIFSGLETMMHQGETYSADPFINHNDINVQSHAATMLAMKYALSDRWAEKGIFITTEEELLYKAVTGSVYSWKNRVVAKMIRAITEQLKTVTDDQEMNRLLKEQMELDSIKKEISQKLGIVVLK
jgi:DNA primase